MPHLDSIFIKNLADYDENFFNEYPIFIESGTHLGNTTFVMEKLFKKIYTIEIKKELFIKTKSKYKGNKINFYLGDSSIILKEICQDISKSAVFFLDGHWSAGQSGKGDKDCPLYEELQIINEHFKQNAILIIDDFRLFGMGPSNSKEVCNWENISKKNVLKIINNRLNKEYHLPSNLHKDDRLILHINKI